MTEQNGEKSDCMKEFEEFIKEHAGATAKEVWIDAWYAGWRGGYQDCQQDRGTSTNG